MQTGSHESTVEDESLWQWFRGAWLTAALTAASLAVSIGVWLNNALQSWDAAKWGYLSPTAIWSGAVWGLLTPVLIHVNPVHWFFNAYWLARCGSSVERHLGIGRYALLVVATAVLGSAAELAVSSSTGVGASGVVYGVIGFMWVCRRHVPEFSRILTHKLLALAVAWIFLCVILTYTGVMAIANAAHFLGLAVGLLAGLIAVGRRKTLAKVALGGLTVVTMATAFVCPWSAYWWLHLASVFANRQDHEGAYLAATEALGLEAGNAEALLAHADASYGLGRYGEAKADLDTLIEADPQQPEYFTRRANAHFALEEYADARDDYSIAADLAPSNAFNFAWRCAACVELESLEQARKDCETALGLDPENREAKEKLTEIDRRLARLPDLAVPRPR